MRFLWNMILDASYVFYQKKYCLYIAKNTFNCSFAKPFSLIYHSNRPTLYCHSSYTNSKEHHKHKRSQQKVCLPYRVVSKNHIICKDSFFWNMSQSCFWHGEILTLRYPVPYATLLCLQFITLAISEQFDYSKYSRLINIL